MCHDLVTLLVTVKQRACNRYRIVGRDEFDAFCIMQSARTLIISPHSSNSQMAVILAAPDVDVHYPTHKLDRSPVTLSVPEWKYHLVTPSKDRIEEFDVDHERLHVVMS